MRLKQMLALLLAMAAVTFVKADSSRQLSLADQDRLEELDEDDRPLLDFYAELKQDGRHPTIRMESLDPPRGPTRGETRILVRAGPLSMWRHKYEKPQCKIGNNILPGSYVSCTKEHKHISALEGRGENNDYICIYCDITPAVEREQSVKLQVTLTGDYSDVQNSLTFEYYNDVIVNQIIPRSGPKDGGTVVQVHGENFKDYEGIRCTFGTSSVLAQYVSDTQLICVSPVSHVTQRAQPFSVTLNDQQFSKSEISFAYFNFPQVFSVSPNRGPEDDHTLIEVRGANFQPFKPGSYFDNKADIYCQFVQMAQKTRATVKDGNTLTCRTPKYSGIHVTELEITLNDQESTVSRQTFTYYKAPIIYEATPSEGPIEGGTLVTISGTEFENSGTIKCYFGSSVVPARFISFQEIQCYSPPTKSAGYVDLFITIRENQNSKKFKFLYYDRPTLATVSPSCGPDTGFTQLEIHGKNFVDLGQNKARCVFNNSIYTYATIYSTEVLYCDSPPFMNKMGYSLIGQNGPNGDFYNVSVTLDGGNDLSDFAVLFHYYKQPKVIDVTPDSGPIGGQTPVSIKVTGLTQPHLCDVQVRFANIDVETKIKGEDTLQIVTPKVAHPGSVVVQVTYNGQQFSKERVVHLKDSQATFEYYQNPIPIFHFPNVGPSTGGTPIKVEAQGFSSKRRLQASADASNPQGKSKLYARFIDTYYKKLIPGTEVIEVQPENYRDDQAVIYSPAMAPKTKALLQISLNAQDWVDVVDPNPKVTHSFETYQAPHVKSLEPAYGPVKPQNNETMTIHGSDFHCADQGCKKMRVRFSNRRGDSFFAPSIWKNEQTIIATIPKYTEPDVLKVEVSMNGDDYTSDGLTYGYFDPYILEVHPRLISTTGKTVVKVKGIGFVDSGEVKVHYAVLNHDLKCNSGDCIKPATFVSANEIRAPIFPQSVMNYKSTGENVQWNRFDIQVSVHKNEHTENAIYLQYFTQPTYKLLSPAETSVNIQVYLLIRIQMEERDIEPIKKHGQPMCRFSDPNGNVMYTEGVLTFSEKALENNFEEADPSIPNAIRCATPIWDWQYDVKLDISVNDYDYSGAIDFKFSEPLVLDRIAPISGPIDGVTHTMLLGSGFKPRQDSKLHYKAKWGQIHTSDINQVSVADFSYTLNKWLNVDPAGNPQLKCYWYEAQDYHRVDSEIKENQKLETISMNSALLVQSSSKFRRLQENDNNYNVTLGGPFYIEVGTDIELDMTHHQSAHSVINVGNSSFTYFEYLPSSVEFYHYKQCTMISMYPTHGITKGGTQVQVTGYDFRYWPEWGVVPMCKFGDKIVKGFFDSTVRIVCEAPPVDRPVENLSFEVSLNGQDWTNTGFTYTYYFEPKIAGFWPDSGKANGGTWVYFYGENFPNIQNQDELNVRFRPQLGTMTEKIMPVTWINNTCIKTITPGGWTEGDIMDLQITFNGEDYDHHGFTFTFYNVEKVFPRSGPSDGHGGDILVMGQGFRPDDQPLCKINETIYKAKSHTWKEIRCPMPPAGPGPDYFGNVPLEISVNNGAEWIVYELGFQYYQQPKVADIWPKTGPAVGAGLINFYGENFRSDFSLAELKCKIGESLGIAFFVTENQIRCIIDEMEQVEEGQRLPAQVALNGYSWTKTVDNTNSKGDHDISGSTFFVPYTVQSIIPASGFVTGGNEVLVIGSGFQKFSEDDDIKPRCRFGTPSNYSITEAQVISFNKIVCLSPPSVTFMGANKAMPHSVPFAVAFTQDSYDPWTYTHHEFMYYHSPIIDSIEPTEVQVGMIKEVIARIDWTKTDKKTNFFFEPLPVEASRWDMIGAQNSESAEISSALLMGTQIKCKFGHFGETIAVYVNATTIKCVTPSINVAPEDIYMEKVDFSVSMNGYDYDYSVNQHLQFTFIGTGSYLSLGFIMLATVLACVLVLSFVLFIQTLYAPNVNQVNNSFNNSSNNYGDLPFTQSQVDQYTLRQTSQQLYSQRGPSQQQSIFRGQSQQL